MDRLSQDLLGKRRVAILFVRHVQKAGIGKPIHPWKPGGCGDIANTKRAVEDVNSSAAAEDFPCCRCVWNLCWSRTERHASLENTLPPNDS